MRTEVSEQIKMDILIVVVFFLVILGLIYALKINRIKKHIDGLQDVLSVISNQTILVNFRVGSTKEWPLVNKLLVII